MITEGLSGKVEVGEAVKGRGERLWLGNLQCAPPNLFTGADIDFVFNYKKIANPFTEEEWRQSLIRDIKGMQRRVNRHYSCLESGDTEDLGRPWEIPLLDPKKAYTLFTDLPEGKTIVDLGKLLKEQFKGSEVKPVPIRCGHGRLLFAVGIVFPPKVSRQEIISYLEGLSSPVVPHPEGEKGERKRRITLWGQFGEEVLNQKLTEFEKAIEEEKQKLWKRVFRELAGQEFDFPFQ